ncbi:MAG: hypothetical protein WCO19_00440 [Candidatus Saccharibacteria bacterium]
MTTPDMPGDLKDALHEGQMNGLIALLSSEKPGLIFTESDRLQAHRALNALALEPELFERLNSLHEDGRSIQAQYFLSQFALHGVIKGSFSFE